MSQGVLDHCRIYWEEPCSFNTMMQEIKFTCAFQIVGSDREEHGSRLHHFQYDYFYYFQFCPIRILWCVWLKTTVDFPRLITLCLKTLIEKQSAMDLMFGVNAGAATGAGTSASHRGVDLGPSRLLRNVQRIPPLTAQQVPWQSQLATGPPVR